MSFVLDTDTCSAYIKAHPLVWNRVGQYSGRLYLSAITLAELTIWECRATAPPKRAQDIKDLLKLVTPLEVTVDVARRFGETQAALMDAGQLAAQMDLLIAATALVHGYTLVTHNVQDYANIRGLTGLTVVDWMVP
jgi:tRNA(fMet)-specific endonuclease VapC